MIEPIEQTMLRQARQRGIRDADDLTCGELTQALEDRDLRERHFLQMLSVLAYRHALLTASALSGGQLPAIEEIFPFWSPAERQQLTLARWRAVMDRQCAQKSEKEEGYGPQHRRP